MTPHDIGYQDGASGLDSNNVFDGDPTYDTGYSEGRASYLKAIGMGGDE